MNVLLHHGILDLSAILRSLSTKKEYRHKLVNVLRRHHVHAVRRPLKTPESSVLFPTIGGITFGDVFRALTTRIKIKEKVRRCAITLDAV